MIARAALAALLLAGAAQAQDAAPPALPPIHPNDLNATNSRARIDQIQRGGNPADYGQMNSLDSLRRQSDNMNDGARLSGQGTTTLAPIPPERPDPAPRAPLSQPGAWPGYRPGYLPRQ